ncbi:MULTISPECIES: M16 family metallopeptidase [Sphingobacterium]|uniref:M16 family metallopeptidase n=1 Tax=Sphingobacterium TaxID=28453 RepID=UPI0008A56CCC|nr:MULTISPECIES: M16 family metallopeptidase [Sphingobacterium]OFV14774.1 peptidase M16 [Sphingobacterium sp. HMSC13C05]HAF36793.1 insulinase family protein [Sphingobacterium sp.]
MDILKKTIGIFSVLLVSFIQLKAQDLKQDPKLVRGKLKNGFQYFIYPNNTNNQQTAIQLFVNAGSLQEEDDQLGLAHFVEHMAFNGSKHYPKNEVITYLESLGVKFGADLNAHTSYDETVYKITIDSKSKENLEKALDIVSDWAFNLSFDSLEIEKERGIIIEEWRTKEGLSARLSDQTLPLIFSHSRYGIRKPIGTLDILRNFRRPTLVDFYQKWYRPNLMGLAVVTNQDPKAVEKMIKKLFGKAKNRKPEAKRISYSLANHTDTLFNIYTDKEANSIDFSYIGILPASKAVKTEADFFENLKRSTVNALLKKRFDRIAQLDDSYKSASMSVSDLLLNNGLSVGGATLYEGQIKSGISKYLKERERILRYGFTSSELSDYREQYKRQLQRAPENKELNANMMLSQLKDVFFTGQILMDKEARNGQILRDLDRLDSLNLLHHLQGYFKPGNTAVMLTAPERLMAEVPNESVLRQLFAESAQADLKKWTDHIEIPQQLLSDLPISGKVIQKKLINEVGVTEWQLSNGARFFLKKNDSRKNHIQLTAFRKGGFIAMDSSDYVNAVYAKNIIGASGAGAFTRAALTKFLNGNSASATFMIAPNREGLSASANQKDIKSMFELIYLKWTQPRVDEKIFGSIKKQGLDAARNKKFNVMDAYNQAINKAIGADDLDENTLSVERIEKDLQIDRIVPVFKERFHSAKDFDFVLVGDFDIDSIQAFVEQYIAALPTGYYRSEQRIPAYKQRQDQEIVQYAGQAEKATVNLFYQTTSTHYDYPEILKNELLENVLKVKLRKNLREEQSGVYGVGVSVSATSEPTDLMRTRINFTCEPSRAEFLIGQVQIELDKIIKDPSYFVEELNNAKVQMHQVYDKQFGKDTFWSAELRNHIYYGFGTWSFFTSYKQMLDQIKAADIADYAKQKLNKAYKVKAVLLPENLKK